MTSLTAFIFRRHTTSKVTLLLLLVALIWLGALPFAMQAKAAGAVPLSGWELEREVQRVAEQIRCMVCQGQSIWDSQSGWSLDRRQEIRDLLIAGQSEAEIIEQFVQQWGTGVLMRPPMTGGFWAVWLLPGALIIVGGAALAALLRRWRQPPADVGGGADADSTAGGERPVGAVDPLAPEDFLAAQRRLQQLQDDF